MHFSSGRGGSERLVRLRSCDSIAGLLQLYINSTAARFYEVEELSILSVNLPESKAKLMLLRANPGIAQLWLNLEVQINTDQLPQSISNLARNPPH